MLAKVSWLAAVALAAGASVAVALAAGASVAVALAAGASVSPGPAQASATRPVLRWSAPRQVDRGRTKIGLPQDAAALGSQRSQGGGVTHGGIPITGISCPTASLCVAVDLNGNALVTRTPRRLTSWRRFAIDAAGPLDAVSCPSPRLCVAVDTMGTVVTSVAPGGGSAAWTAVKIRRDVELGGTALGVPLTAVSCASAHLCVSGDDYPREIMTTTRPRGGPAAWRDRIGIGHRHSGEGLISVSCPSTRFCAALGDAAIYASSAPIGPASTKLTVGTPLEAISCGSRSLCVAVAGTGEPGGFGGVWRSTDPAARHPHWALTHPDFNQQFAVACRGEGLCVATDSAGEVMMSAHPAAADPSWQTAHVDGANVMSGISCPTTKLCVAADTSGNVLVGRR